MQTCVLRLQSVRFGFGAEVGQKAVLPLHLPSSAHSESFRHLAPCLRNSHWGVQQGPWLGLERPQIAVRGLSPTQKEIPVASADRDPPLNQHPLRGRRATPVGLPTLTAARRRKTFPSKLNLKSPVAFFSPPPLSSPGLWAACLALPSSLLSSQQPCEVD